MSTIGSLPGFQPGPPEARTAHSLANKIDTGEISSTDGAALASSLEAIHGELRTDRQEHRAQGGSKPSKEELTAKIDDLISSQVESGALTEEQGEQLSELFQETLAKGKGPKGEGGEGGPNGDLGGPRGPGGPGGAGGGGKSDALVQFLQQLQQENATEYSEDGTLSSNQSLLFDYTA